MNNEYSDEIELEIDFGDSNQPQQDNEIELEIDFGDSKKPEEKTENKPFSESQKKDFTPTFGDLNIKPKPKVTSFGIFKKCPIDLKFKDYKVLHPYVAKLQIKDVALINMKGIKNRYYLIKVLVKGNNEDIGFFAKWGRIGSDPDYLFEKTSSVQEAIKKFKAKFLEKTFNEWDKKENFNPVVGGYTMLGLGNFENFEQETEKKTGKERNMNDLKFLEKLELIDKKIMTEVSSLNYELAMVMRDIFSVNNLSNIISDVGVDKLKLGLENLRRINVTGAHQTLFELQNELTSNSKRFNRIFQLSEKFDQYIPILRRKANVNLIDDLDKLKMRFSVVEHVRDVLPSVELYKAIVMKSGAEKNPIDLIYGKLETHLVKIEKETEEFELVVQMMGTHGKNHGTFELELRDVFALKNNEQEVNFYPFKKINRKLLWLGGRASKMGCILK